MITKYCVELAGRLAFAPATPMRKVSKSKVVCLPHKQEKQACGQCFVRFW